MKENQCITHCGSCTEPTTARLAAVVLRSFVTSCELARIDPFALFRDVLGRIAEHPVKRLEELLPHRWAQVAR